MCRKSLLSGTSLDWGAFEYSSEPTQFTDAVWNYTGTLGSKRIAEVYIPVTSDFSVSPNSWTVTNWSFPFKCKIIQAYDIPCSKTDAVQDFVSRSANDIRIGAFLDTLRIQLASISTEKNQDFIKGDVIYIKIIEL